MLKNVVLSIKPQYVEKILIGVKKYEYRKYVFKQPVSRVYIYESYPVKKIVAEFDFETSFSDTPVRIWEKTKEFSGIDENVFFDYFRCSAYAHAINIKNLRVYVHPVDPYDLIPNFKAPQSFCYIEDIPIQPRVM